MEVGDFGTVARDRVRSIVVIGRAHLLGHRGSNVVGEEAKGGPGVDDGLELLGHGFGTSRQTVDGDAPEALAVVDRHSGQFAADLGFVVATEGVCTTTVCGFAQKNAINGRVDEFLANEVINRSLYSCNSADGIETQPQEPVDLILLEPGRDLVGHFDRLANDIEAAQGDRVSAQDALRRRPVAITDRPRAAVLLVGAALRRVVDGLAFARLARGIGEP
ncbi:hypothetical protein BC936DRAFT_145907 [Jimgerdemannia flammicorona]|uniref:Uncharacterized protein n=1 Tax=Jimgerdemannia flammicorona TaxID=994334 RepID=A0A433D8W9_9FUNG|nr:hypothetical protein BC936DRAFT_145907 [Jimgerdemannia flammicorona]